MTVRWKDEAWNEYVNWQTEDKKTLKRINKLIKSIQRMDYSKAQVNQSL